MPQGTNSFPFTVLLGAAFLLSGVGVFVYQIYEWLRYGEWVPMSILWLLNFHEGLQSWVYYPTEWVGVHTALGWVPLSLTLFLLGIVILANEE